MFNKIFNKKTEYVDMSEVYKKLDPTMTVVRINKFRRSLNPHYTGV